MGTRRPHIGGIVVGTLAYGGWLLTETSGYSDLTWDQLVPITALVCLVLIGFGVVARRRVVLGLGIGIALGFLAVFAYTLILVIYVIGDV